MFLIYVLSAYIKKKLFKKTVWKFEIETLIFSVDDKADTREKHTRFVANF